MKNRKNNGSWTLLGSAGAAAAAAVCCFGPLVLVSLGATGAWIGTLSALEPYRPLFMLVAAGLLGWGFYGVYGKRAAAQACEEGAACEVPQAQRINQLSLWMATLFVAALFASPYLLNVSFAEEDSPPGPAAAAGLVAPGLVAPGLAAPASMATATLAIEGMTCAGCSKTIAVLLKKVDGVHELEVTFEPPRAWIRYDPSKVTADALARALTENGYPATLKPINP